MMFIVVLVCASGVYLHSFFIARLNYYVFFSVGWEGCMCLDLDDSLMKSLTALTTACMSGLTPDKVMAFASCHSDSEAHFDG